MGGEQKARLGDVPVWGGREHVSRDVGRWHHLGGKVGFQGTLLVSHPTSVAHAVLRGFK